MDLQKGSKVLLMQNNNCVAMGMIENMDASNVNHFASLERGRASVHVIKVYNGSICLHDDPFLDFLEESEGAFISWPLCDLKKLEDQTSLLPPSKASPVNDVCQFINICVLDVI
jgi:hypothetical protein